MFGVDDQPRKPPPPAVGWFQKYCYARLALDAFLLLLALISVGLTLEGRERTAAGHDVAAGGLMFAVIGVVDALANFVVVRMESDPSKWTFGLLLIASGCLHPCCVPVSLPMLLLWLRRDTQEFYGRA